MTIFGFMQNPLTFGKSSPAHELHKLIDIRRTRWLMEYIPLPSSQFSIVALFTLLEDLNNPSSASTFADTAISLFSIAKRLQLAKSMFRLVQGTGLQKELGLAPEIHSIFRDFNEVLWAKEDKEKFSSLYPNFAITVNKETVGEVDLDDFLEQWDSLALERVILLIGNDCMGSMFGT